MAFLPNPKLQEELNADPEIRKGIASQIESTRALAESYAKSIMPRAGRRLAEIVTTDEGVHLVLTAYGGHLDEFGGVNNAPNAPLRRAADSTGLRFEETPKP